MVGRPTSVGDSTSFEDFTSLGHSTSAGYISAGHPSVGHPSVGDPFVGHPSVGHPSIGQPSPARKPSSVGHTSSAQHIEVLPCSATPVYIGPYPLDVPSWRKDPFSVIAYKNSDLPKDLYVFLENHFIPVPVGRKYRVLISTSDDHILGILAGRTRTMYLGLYAVHLGKYKRVTIPPNGHPPGPDRAQLMHQLEENQLYDQREFHFPFVKGSREVSVQTFIQGPSSARH